MFFSVWSWLQPKVCVHSRRSSVTQSFSLFCKTTLISLVTTARLDCNCPKFLSRHFGPALVSPTFQRVMFYCFRYSYLSEEISGNFYVQLCFRGLIKCILCVIWNWPEVAPQVGGCFCIFLRDLLCKLFNDTFKMYLFIHFLFWYSGLNGRMFIITRAIKLEGDGCFKHLRRVRICDENAVISSSKMLRLTFLHFFFVGKVNYLIIKVKDRTWPVYALLMEFISFQEFNLCAPKARVRVYIFILYMGGWACICENDYTCKQPD